MNDELVSIAHLLLDELEFFADLVRDTEAGRTGCYDEYYSDAKAVIERAKEILSRYPI